MARELRAVAATKLVPAVRVMAEPGAQLGARRDLLEPFVEPGLRLADAARPQPVDEDPCAVRSFGRLVGALQPYVGCGDRAVDDSSDLRKLAGSSAAVRPAKRALELDFGEEAFVIAVHHGHGLLAAFAQIGDRAVALHDRTVDQDLVPFLRMPDIGDSEVMLLGPEEGDCIERFTPAEHVARRGLALALGDDKMLDADGLAAVRIRPAGDVPGGEHAWCAGLEEPVDEHSAV